MIILNCSNITKSYGVDTIFEKVSFNVQENEKVGLVGVNGGGKSTIFKMITDELSPDSGEIYKSGNLTIGYMAQNFVMDSQKSIWDELLTAFAPVIELEKKIKVHEKEIENTHDEEKLNILIHEHADLCEMFSQQNGYGFTSHIRAVLVGLGFQDEQFMLPVWKLSGGQKTRVALAKILLQNPQLILLDEPTNHLDIQAVEWLEGFLEGYKGSIMVISHDRFFLDKVTNKTIELENQKASVYEGNYSKYMERKQVIREQQWKQYNLQQREISRIQGIIEQQRQWNREKNIKTAESKQKSIDRMEKLEKPENLPDAIRFQFKCRVNSANDVIIAEDLEKSFDGRRLFKNLTFKIKKGERIFLLGGNGTGKTTLFRILLDQISKDAGLVKWGTNVIPGYYDQEQTNLNVANSVMDEVWDANPQLTQTEIRNALAAFLFKGDDVFKTISSLSGGEKGRVTLVKLMLSQTNFLILDEPTNHLDINSREALESALQDYDGTLFVVSHDRYFINKIASKIFELTPDGICEWIGNYNDYIEKRKKLDALARQKDNDESIGAKGAGGESSSKQDYLKQKEVAAAERKKQRIINKLEGEIEAYESEIQELEQQLYDPEISADYQKALEIGKSVEKLKDELEQLYSEWEKAQNE